MVAFQLFGDINGAAYGRMVGQVLPPWLSGVFAAAIAAAVIAHVPLEVAAQGRHQRACAAAHGGALLSDVAEREAAAGERVVESNDHWLAIVPFWAAWPFETLRLPRFAVQRLPQLGDVQRESLASILKALTMRYYLFQASFPYSMGWHAAPFGAPFGSDDTDHWQLNAHFFPPLLRSALMRKFMAGYGMLAEPQRDLTPEPAAEMLREVSGMVHYRG